MPSTPFHCNWCRKHIGTYRDAGAVSGPFSPEGAPPHTLADHLRTGVVAQAEDGPIVAYPCPECGRNNLLQLPHAAAR